LLAERIVSGRSADDRKILPKLLLRWEIDMMAIALPGGVPLWVSLTDRTSGVLAKRNRVVHDGEEASQPEVILAINCARTVLSDIVYRLSSKLGFTLKTTGCWSEIRSERLFQKFSAQDPISRKPFESSLSKLLPRE
jgi:hypothetical protein